MSEPTSQDQLMFIYQTPDYKIQRIFAYNSLRNYTYIVVRVETLEALVVDPWDGEVAWDWCRQEGVRPIGTFNTHQHHDHIRGNAFLSERGVQVLTSLPAAWQGDWSVWPAPGHSCEHQVLYLAQPPVLLAGDTLFQAGVGNCKNGGDPTALFHTIMDFKAKLAPQTVIAPGHDYLKRNLEFAAHVEPSNEQVQNWLRPTAQRATEETLPLTWAQELSLNPFLRTSEQGLRENLASQQDSDEIVFKKLRRLRDDW
jgi:hydroxyacylglutathione hydrolase